MLTSWFGLLRDAAAAVWVRGKEALVRLAALWNRGRQLGRLRREVMAPGSVRWGVTAPGVGDASKSFAWELFFSPHGGCTPAIVTALSQARREVRVQAYAFTSKPIAQALVEARRRGCDVRVIVENDQRASRGCQAEICRAAGIEVTFDGRHLIAHNKVIVIDGQVVVTGSFNFSASAESNAENLLVIRDAALATRYLANWQQHREHAEP